MHNLQPNERGMWKDGRLWRELWGGENYKESGEARISRSSISADDKEECRPGI